MKAHVKRCEKTARDMHNDFTFVATIALDSTFKSMVSSEAVSEVESFGDSIVYALDFATMAVRSTVRESVE